MTIEYQLTLDYQLQAGWLEPFIRGLQQGIAVARRCHACEKISFPPLRVCNCHHTHGKWVNLSGGARIVYRCDGTEGSFALVQFDGADTQTVVRLDNMSDAEVIGYLKKSPSENPNNTPALVLTAHQHDDNRQ